MQTASAVRTSTLDLSVVMPVYNEAAGVGTVIRSWVDELDRLGIRYEFLAYDDGSRDETADVLRRIAAERPTVVPHSHRNVGHGPTISRGYREALGDWVFQVDSDDEMAPAGFAQLWAGRDNYDLLLGCRSNRQQSLARSIISRGSRLVVRALFGTGLWDVNTPYRLVRRTALTAMLPSMPSEAFAPNVIMSGLAVRRGLRIHQTWVPHQQRRMGTTSLANWRQWKVAVRCAVETAAVAFGNRRASPDGTDVAD